MNTPFLLLILDGFGLNPHHEGNGVALARKPHFDRLWQQSPRTTLITFGERVGLPEGQMGNSEVGHLNIGAGRVVEQWLLRITRALANPASVEGPRLDAFVTTVKDAPCLHLIGLLSDGGVHSHRDHLLALLARVEKNYQGTIALHLITDGRDTSPTSGLREVEQIEHYVSTHPRVTIATVSGRFFAMDRDKRSERTEKAYRAIVEGHGISTGASAHLKASYEQKVTDEFIEPAVVHELPINNRDAIIMWNFREDRVRQLLRALTSPADQGFPRTRTPVVSPERILTFTEYEHGLGVPFLFHPIEVQNHFGAVISKAGLRQLRVAETEKYPHVTYFFNGGVEQPEPGEERALFPSPRDVKTYDLKPEMSAAAVTEKVVSALRNRESDVIVANLANCDMVGHTGVVPAVVRAVEAVDHALGAMEAALTSVGGRGIVLADHGNAEQLIAPDGSPHTAHTTFPVPCFVLGDVGRINLRDGGALCDVAPTALELIGLPQPKEMTGRSLVTP